MPRVRLPHSPGRTVAGDTAPGDMGEERETWGGPK